MSSETFQAAQELAPALRAILLCYGHSKELAARGSSGVGAGSSRSRRAGHRNEGRKSFYGAKRLLGRLLHL